MHYALQFLLLVLVSVFACAKVTLQGSMSRKHIRTVSDTLWFNVLLFACIALLFAVLFPVGKLDATILIFGVTAGATTVVAQSFYAFAFNTGPVSLTVLIANFSILISTLFCAFAFNEKLYLSQSIGIVCLIVCMILSRSRNDGDARASRRWLIYSLLVMCAFGIGNSVQKIFWITESSKAPNSEITLLVVMYSAAALLAFVIYAVLAFTGKRQKSGLGFQKPVLGYVLGIGASLCAFQKSSMFAMANIDGTFYFPTLSGLQTLWVTVIGVLFFHDRLSRKQKLGVAFGVACVALMNVRFGPAIQF